jgi:N,N'-diacetyllegionaminate synthase
MNKKRVIIIAEAGVNHNGQLKIAKKLISAAKDIGADYIKFQSFKAEKLVTKNAELANYQKKNTKDLTQYKMI